MSLQSDVEVGLIKRDSSREDMMIVIQFLCFQIGKKGMVLSSGEVRESITPSAVQLVHGKVISGVRRPN